MTPFPIADDVRKPRPGLASQTVAAVRSSEARIVVAGAGGWLGLATLELLYDALGDRFASRVHCFGSNARTLHLRDIAIDQRPLAELASLPCAPTILLHLAFLTKDRVADMAAADYERANRALSARVLDALDPIGATAVFVASSGAARAAGDPTADHAMRLYGGLKQQDEEAFANWAERAAATAVIARIFNVAGPYINKHQAYALAAFIKNALAGEPIRVRAGHRVVRGYVAIRELMSLVLLLLLETPRRITRFDTGGTPLELEDVARHVADAVAPVAVERAPITSDRIDEYVGDAKHYDALCAARGIRTVALADQIRETAQSLIAM